ncbi:hypothetical protein DFH27DRAFT_302222 [Peziza echinospora]|nr:hypothetical protein DFH27DRAFT_302222 [Peziza echinospora]
MCTTFHSRFSIILQLPTILSVIPDIWCKPGMLNRYTSYLTASSKFQGDGCATATHPTSQDHKKYHEEGLRRAEFFFPGMMRSFCLNVDGSLRDRGSYDLPSGSTVLLDSSLE